LIRIHKFGHLDIGCVDDESIKNLPSFKAMLQFAQEDSKAAEEHAREVFTPQLEGLSPEVKAEELSKHSFEYFKSKITDRDTSTEKLKPTLIDGVVRRCGVLCFTGPSKIGKTMRMVELASALQNGDKWLGRECKKSKVLFINPEVDEAEFHAREREMYALDKVEPFKTITIMGLFLPFTHIINYCLRLIKEEQYNVFIFDSIYMIVDAKENDNDETKKALKQFDRLREAGATVIYSHHHKKGAFNTEDATERYAGASSHGRYVTALIDISYVPEFKSEAGERGIMMTSMLRNFPQFTDYFYQTYPFYSTDDGKIKAHHEKPKELKRAETKQNRYKDREVILIDAWKHIYAKKGEVTKGELRETYPGGIDRKIFSEVLSKSSCFEVTRDGKKHIVNYLDCS